MAVMHELHKTLYVVEADNRCIPYGRTHVLTRRILGGWGQPPSQIEHTPIISVQVNKYSG